VAVTPGHCFLQRHRVHLLHPPEILGSHQRGALRKYDFGDTYGRCRCYCKRIRNDQNYWEQLETYLSDHSEALFSHGICPSCYQSIMKPQLEGAAADKP